MFEQLLKNLWYPKRGQSYSEITAAAFLLLLLLVPSIIYGCLFVLYKWCKTIITNTVTTKTPIISVGNISVGGTGKTEVICSLIEEFGSDNVVVVAKGYNAVKPVVVPTRLLPSSSALIYGDEPVMVKQRFNCEVIVSHRKVEGVLYADKLIQQQKIQAKVILLDDGYQQFSLKISKNILLLDAVHPFGNGFLFPLGPLREYDISRADSVIVTGSSVLNSCQKKTLKKKIARKNPKRIDISFAKYSSRVITFDKKTISASDLKTRKVLLLAGIARPDGFFAAMNKQACVQEVFSYPDHYQYKANDISGLLAAAEEKKADFIITTSKDWVKIEPLIFDTDKSKFLISVVSLNRHTI